MHLDRQAALSEPGWLPLTECAGRARGEVGRKASRLAQLAAEGLRTPGGFVLPSAAFRAVLGRCGVAGRVRYLEQAALALDPKHVLAIAAEIAGELAGGVVAEEARRWASLLMRREAEFPLVCRSSAAMEDGEAAAFPGLFTSVLDIGSEAALAEAIARCWRSVFGAELVRYVLRVRPAEVDFSLALLVQRQVAAEAYGVLFSADPLGGRGGVVEFHRGAPDALVHGAAPSQRFRWCKGEWSGDAPVPLAVRALAAMVPRLEAIAGGAVDVEFAADDGAAEPVLLQVRRISAIRAERSGDAAAGERIEGQGCAPGRVVGTGGEEVLLLEAVSVEDYARIMASRAVVAAAETSPLGHAAILCRELGIALVAGVGARLAQLAGERVLVDGGRGRVVLSPEEDALPAVERAGGWAEVLTLSADEVLLRLLAAGEGARSDVLLEELRLATGAREVRIGDAPADPELLALAEERFGLSVGPEFGDRAPDIPLPSAPR